MHNTYENQNGRPFFASKIIFCSSSEKITFWKDKLKSESWGSILGRKGLILSVKVEILNPKNLEKSITEMKGSIFPLQKWEDRSLKWNIPQRFFSFKGSILDNQRINPYASEPKFLSYLHPGFDRYSGDFNFECSRCHSSHAISIWI